MNRNLDGVYFRVKRGDKWENICFSDLTIEERDEVCQNRSEEWFKSLAYRLADVVKEIGDTFNLVGE